MDTKYLEIIKAPVVTEKAAVLAEANTYEFYVDVYDFESFLYVAILFLQNAVLIANLLIIQQLLFHM